MMGYRANLFSWGALAALLIVGLAARWMFLFAPPLDFHATRQLRGVILARGFYYQLRPGPDPEKQADALEYLGSMERFEPPVLEQLVARTYLLVGGEAPWVARVYVSTIWVLGSVLVYALAGRLASRAAGWFVTGVYLLLPFGVIASRSFQPDTLMVVFLVGVAWGLYRWQESGNWRWTLVTGVCAGLAGLIKPFALLPAGSMALAVFFYQLKLRGLVRSPHWWSFVLLAVIPGAVYYLSTGAGAGNYFASWTLDVLHLVLRPSFYIQWLLQIDEVLGLGLFFLALLGVLLSKPEHKPLLMGWWIGYAAYGFLLPYLVTTHNYYSLYLVPLAALSLASPVELVLEKLKEQPWLWRAVAVGVMGIAAGFALWQVRDTLEKGDQTALVEIWQAAAEAVPEGSSVLALTQYYGYPLMVYGWQKVSLWPSTGEQQLSSLRGQEAGPLRELFDEMIQGKTHFLVTDFDELEKQPDLAILLAETYPVAAQGAGYLLYDLQSK